MTRSGNRSETKAQQSAVDDLELDAVIVGAGLAGIYLLYLLRKEGFNVKIIEANDDIGGVWHQNSYPGARVDSPYPVYALNIPEVYSTWRWKEQYPSGKALKAYFRHIDNVLDISQDTIFQTRVTTAVYDENVHRWRIQAENGNTFTAQFFCSCIGFASKPYTPKWPGMFDTYQGVITHSSCWPKEGIDVSKKQLSIIGTGATGIQLAQELARDAKRLTCFVRTPNLCFPMRQSRIDHEEAGTDNERLRQLLSSDRFANFGGFLFPEPKHAMHEHSPEEQQAILEDCFRLGGFRLLTCYLDVLTSQEANDKVYAFWREKCAARISDQKKRDILAPREAPHPIGGKRPSLEQDYYEQMDKPHVTIVDTKATPISHFVKNGIVTTDNQLHEADVIVMATGFDSFTGAFDAMAIQGRLGRKLNEKWADGVLTYLGTTVEGFPNMFLLYGPHSPTAYGNGPTILESQAKWIVKVLRKMKAEKATTLEAQPAAEKHWTNQITTIHAATLRHHVDSWYMGANVPGKPHGALIYAGGVPRYIEELNNAIEPVWNGLACNRE